MRNSKSRAVIRNILITGNPGVGKTTLIRDIISRLDASAGGFYTAEVRDERGRRWGFRIVDLDGGEDVLASVEVTSQRRVSKYGVDVAAVDRIGVTAVRDALRNKEMVVIDEIGRMELASEQFRNVAMKALDHRKPLLGTIPIKDTGMAKKLKERQDTTVVKLTRANFPEVKTYVERLLTRLALVVHDE